jgi:hypothetical protein
MSLVKEVLGPNDISIEIRHINHVLVYDVLVPVVTELVEHGLRDVLRDVGQCIEPIFVVIKVVIKDIGSPGFRGM